MKKLTLPLIFMLFCSFIPTSCTQNTPPNEKKEVIAILHAGGELDGNTYLNCQEAFYEYYEQGYRYFEYDFKLSSDGKLIATHSWEYLDGGYDGMSYQQFTSLTLEVGYTPVNEEWLIEMLVQYPDVTVIADAKMQTTEEDAQVILRLDALQDEYQIDLSARIIPEIFSVEMWNTVHEETNFNHYLFSRYKEYYSVQDAIEYFPVEKFIGFAIGYDYLDGHYKDNLSYLQSLGYRIFLFGLYSAEDVRGAIDLGADAVYVDTPDMLPKY